MADKKNIFCNDKICYKNYNDAITFFKKNTKNKILGKELYIYCCPECGYVHFTSNKQGDFKRKKAERRKRNKKKIDKFKKYEFNNLKQRIGDYHDKTF